MKLWLVRHPQPDVPTGLCYGISDVPVVESHLDELVERLPQHLPRDAALWSSPCLTAAQHQRRSKQCQSTDSGPIRDD